MQEWIMEQDYIIWKTECQRKKGRSASRVQWNKVSRRFRPLLGTRRLDKLKHSLVFSIYLLLYTYTDISYNNTYIYKFSHALLSAPAFIRCARSYSHDAFLLFQIKRASLRLRNSILGSFFHYAMHTRMPMVIFFFFWFADVVWQWEYFIA